MHSTSRIAGFLHSTIIFIILLVNIGLTSSFVVFLKRDDFADEYTDIDVEPSRERRSASKFMLGISEVEDVCKTRIIPNHRPRTGHIHNGSRVEIQQEEDFYFEATFIECEAEERLPCKGIDTRRFSSECVTQYEHRPAGIRLLGSTGPYYKGSIRIPIMCQCRLRRFKGTSVGSIF